MGEKVDQLVLSGNSYKGPSAVGGWEADDPRIIRDEPSKAVPAAIKYDFNHVPHGKPASSKIWDVTDFGAARGTFRELPKEDSTAAFQKALDAAGAANVECRKMLTIESDPSADVKIGVNGMFSK